MTIEQVIKELVDEKDKKLESRFPCRVIMVSHVDQYIALLSQLRTIADVEVVPSSWLFSSADLMPRYENLNDKYDGRWLVLPGVSEYLRLFSREEMQTQRFGKLWNHQAPSTYTGKIIIPLWGCKAQWHDRSLHLAEDIRKEKFYFDCTSENAFDQQLCITVLSDRFQSYVGQLKGQSSTMFLGLQEWYEYWADPVSGKQDYILLTGKYGKIQPSTGDITIRVIKDMLSFIQSNLQDGDLLTAENCPDEALAMLFEYALKGVSLETAVLSCLNTEEFNTTDIMGRWKLFTPGQKQLAMMWIKLHPDESYLYHCVQRAESVASLREPILHEIFSVQHHDQGWIAESQELVSAMGIERDDEYLENLNQIPTYEERLLFLTGASEKERIYLLHLVGQWLRLDASQVYSNTKIKELYPELIAYLDGAAYDEDLRRYMALYKAHKLENSLPQDEDLYFAGIQTDGYDYRHAVLSNAIKNNTVLLWIDALGVEWLPLLLWVLQEDQKGIIQEYSVTMANLPTETEFNKQWEQMDIKYQKLDRLDKLAHKGVIDDPDYYACVEQQFQFIKSIATTVRKLFKEYQRVIITGDHGTSRLAARFFHNRDGFPVPQGGKVCSHGRYCRVPGKPATLLSTQREAKDQDGNYYIVFKNYDHFTQPGFAAGADDENAIYGEVHGGGSPEEALIPVIVVDSREPLKQSAKWKKNPVKISMKKINATVQFSLSVNHLEATIGTTQAECNGGQDSKEWQITFKGIPDGNYSVVLLADGKIVPAEVLHVLPAIGGGDGDLP